MVLSSNITSVFHAEILSRWFPTIFILWWAVNACKSNPDLIQSLGGRDSWVFGLQALRYARSRQLFWCSSMHIAIFTQSEPRNWCLLPCRVNGTSKVFLRREMEVASRGPTHCPLQTGVVLDWRNNGLSIISFSSIPFSCRIWTTWQFLCSPNVRVTLEVMPNEAWY